jgi:hypothetical protein
MCFHVLRLGSGLRGQLQGRLGGRLWSGLGSRLGGGLWSRLGSLPMPLLLLPPGLLGWLPCGLAQVLLEQ